MSQVSTVLVRQRVRLREIVEILARYGLAGYAHHAAQAHPGGDNHHSLGTLAARADPALAALSTGQRVRGALSELGTTWIKLGQMLSVRPDIVGAEVADELTKLQSAVPADPPGHAEQVIQAELKEPVGTLFASFDPQPLASGSVAQVHRATTHDGADVVVKVLHADVERRVLADLELMAALAAYVESVDPAFARYRPTKVVAEFETLMRSAINLTQEAHNLTRFRLTFADQPDVAIPGDYPILSSKRVLTMDRMTGAVLDDQDSVASVAWNVDELAHRTSEIYLDMIFRDGHYHADPHPGNFLLNRGSITILDFGDVGNLTPAGRQRLEALLIAIAEGSLDDLSEAMFEMTGATPNTDRNRLDANVTELMGPFLASDTSGLDIDAFVRAILEVIHRSQLQLPSDLASVLRVMSLLQGLAAKVGAHVDFVEMVRPHIERFQMSRFDPKRLKQQATRRLRSWDTLLGALPDDLREIAARLRDGSATVNIDLHDPDNRIDQLVDGLIVAALTVGASELLSRQARPTVGSTSAPGAVAAALALAMYTRLRRRSGAYVPLRTRVAGLVQFVAESRPIRTVADRGQTPPK